MLLAMMNSAHPRPILKRDSVVAEAPCMDPTTDTTQRRLLGGSAPCRLKPNPPGLPHKESPTGIPNNQKYRAAACGGGKMKQIMELKRDSRVIAARVAMDQLEALGAQCFDIGVKRLDGTMILRERWSAKQVLKALLWLRRENLNHGHITCDPQVRMGSIWSMTSRLTRSRE